MDLEERRFSGKVYCRRNRKTQKREASPATAAAVETAADVTKVSETLDSDQPTKVVVPQNDQDLVITNSTSGDVPQGGVELREGSCGGEVGENGNDRVTISLSESRSGGEIRNVRRRLEGELDDVRRLVNKVEAKEKLQRRSTSLNNRISLVLIPGRPRVSCRYPRFRVDDMMIRNPNPLVRPIDVPTPFRPPSNGIVEREKRIPKVNRYYDSSDYLLGKDKLPSHIYKKSKKKGFGTCRNPIPFVDSLRQVYEARTLERCKSTTRAADPRKKKPSNKRDMTTDEIERLNRDLENLPPEEAGAVAELIKKRGVRFKQINEELQVDIDSVDEETLWELDRFVTNYNKRKRKLAEVAPTRSWGPKIGAAWKESTSGTSRHVEGGREADNASSESGSSSSDSDSDSSSS